jgi:hypothetical protein
MRSEIIPAIPDFEIAPVGEISKAFLYNKIGNFKLATDYVAQLRYGRNLNKNNLYCLFEEQCGTCSTKHALLKGLAKENGFHEIKLFIGIFKMNGINTPNIKSILELYRLDYIPEAHCYLKFKGHIFDFTKKNSKASDFIDDLIEELEIEANQIVDFKVNYHQNYLKQWLTQNESILYSLNELWAIREKCIQVF